MWSLLVALPSLSAVPSLSSLGIEWDNMPLRAMPVVTNFYGAATLRRDVEAGYGLISLGPITSAPFNGNFQNSTFLVNGQTARVKRVRWESCESTRSASFTFTNSTSANPDAPCTVDVLNRVRMPFEDHGFFQVWELNSASCVRNVEMRLDGPLFRRCDLGDSCGWGTPMPIDRQSFARSIQVDAGNLNVMVVEDKRTAAVSASIVWVDTDSGSSAAGSTTVKLDDARLGFTFSFSPSASVTKLVAKQVVAVGIDANSAITAALTYYKQFSQSWSDACAKYEERWSGAFQAPNKLDDGLAPRHFSGNLPALQSNSPELDRLYYWSALALVSLERTNLKTFPRNFVISEGAAVSLDGKDNMGGTGQFVWDLSFSSATLSLLEPEATKNLIFYLIRYSDLSSSPLQTPQFWDAYTERMPAIGVYCFDYLATFYLIQQYISITNDTSSAFLQTPVQNVLDPKQTITPLEYLRRLAWSWRSYPHYSQSLFLADYGANKRSFLEAVPTYRDIVPALQFGNAGMLLAMSDVFSMLDKTKYAREIQDMRGNATGIVQDSLRFLYNPGTGYWSCLTDGEYANGNKSSGNRTGQKKMEVRAIADMGYLGIALGMMGRRTSSLIPEGIRTEVAQFFNNELLADGWVRALSLKDPVMRNVQSLTPSVQDLVAMRSDWTGTGSYGGLAGICIDSLAEMELGFDSALAALLNISYAARNSMPAQGMAVMTPPYMQKFLENNDGLAAPSGPYAPNWPEFFDVSGFPPWWPSTSRSLQNAEASVADAFIHSIFGWRPNWISLPVSSSFSPSDAINAALWLPSTSRAGKMQGSSFKGVLSGVRTPYGYIDITADTKGLSWKWSQ